MPRAVAVQDGRYQLTYAELVDRAAAVAAWILESGAVLSADARIAVVGARSARAIIAFLGAWRAGAAYLPVAADFPPDRVDFILDDAVPRAILFDEETISESLRARLARRSDALSIQAAEAAGAGVQRAGVDPVLRPDQPAYVIYTSGSTGKPKGAVLGHANLVNFLANHKRDFGLSELDRHGWAVNVAFDLSVADIWPPLAAGSTVCVAPQTVKTRLRAMLDWLRDDRITTVLLVTAVMNMLLARTDEWWAGSELRLVCTCGDRLLRRPPLHLPFRFLNLYGPTECTVWATVAETRATVLTGRWPIPSIGSPIGNTHIAVVGPDLEPCAVGVEGELCIGGACVGLGYLQRPELTDVHFIPDSFADDGTGRRLYRTGDRAVVLEDGIIEFAGRADRQIAIHGYRIEAGEVEATILAVGDVSEVVVQRHEGKGSGARLVAYVVFVEGAHAAVGELRARLAEKLPAYMVPGQIVVLDALPRTPTGKIDVASLTPRRLVRGDVPSRFVAPRSETEQRIAAMFANLLEFDRVGRDDDFFELGGDSLGAVELASMIEDTFAIEFAEGSLGNVSTPAAFAAAIGSEGDAGGVGAINWERECAVDFPGPRAHGQRSDPRMTGGQRGFFVTGASGFVGRAVVGHLLKQASTDFVFGLSRHPGAVIAEASDADKRGAQFVDLKGDLRAHGLGLSQADVDRLRAHVDFVLHVGAEVNHVKSYRGLRDANVEGTAEVARLAIDLGGLPMIYVSTIDVARGETGDVVPETTGYAQSKWVAERQLARARALGLPVRTIRLGRVLPSQSHERVNAHDTLVLLLRASAALGLAPRWGTVEIGTPADVVASSIVAALPKVDGARDSEAFVTYPVMHPVHYTELFGRLVNSGRARWSDHAEWLASLRSSDIPEARLLDALLAGATEAELKGERATELADRAATFTPVIDVGWPGFDDAYWDRLVARCTPA